MKDISVIIPAYNVEKFLTHCLDSILASGPESMEVLLINDGSTDKTAELCFQYAKRDSRIILSNQNNSGAVAARNRGLDMACGTYVLFVDADDYVSSDYVHALYKTALATSADIVLCNLHRVRQGNIIETTNYPAKTLKLVAERLSLVKETYYPGPYAKMIHRKLLEDNAIRFLVEEGYFGFAEDMLFALHTTYTAQKIVFCPDAIYSYSMDNNNSICSNPLVQQRNNKDRLIIIRHMLDFALQKELHGEALLYVLQAVENHLYWGGISTLQIFMSDLHERNYPEIITMHFQKFAEEWSKHSSMQAKIKEKIKKNLQHYPFLYKTISTIYSRLKN